MKPEPFVFLFSDFGAHTSFFLCVPRDFIINALL